MKIWSNRQLVLPWSDAKFPAVDIGDNVVIRIPDMDKGKTDLPNLIGVVLDKNEQDINLRLKTEF